MEVILIQGKENTGKTTLCKKIEKILQNSGFILDKDENGNEMREVGENNGNKLDFTAIYKKKDCIIIINSESEEDGRRRFEEMYKKKKSLCYTILITAIRKRNTNKVREGIKDVYGNKKPDYVIDLDEEKRNNEDLDFCEFIEKVLKEKANEIWEKLNCKIEINMPIK